MRVLIKKFIKYKNFLFQTRASILIEFAILFPIFLALVFMILNTFFMMFIENALEAAVREAGRYGITGNSQSGFSRNQSILGIVQQTCKNYSGGLINVGNLSLSITAYPNLTQEATGTGGTLNSYGTSSQTVLYILTYPWTNYYIGSQIILKAQTPVVNENFTVS